MKIVILVRVTVLLVCISLINTGLRSVRASLWQVRHILVSCDAALSDELKQDIEQCIFASEHQGSYNPSALVSFLLQNFPVIHDVSVQRLAFNTAELVVRAHEPCAYVNNSHILTQQGLLLERAQYSAESVALCQKLSIAATPLPPSLSDQTMATVKEILAQDVASSYQLVLINNHELRLYDKITPQFCIVCDAAHIPEQSTLDRCQILKKDLLSRATGKQNKKWKADIRFHDQIVVSLQKGGEYDSFIS